MSAYAQNTPVTILAFGDSLTAGYGLGPSDAYPTLLEQALRAKGYDVKINNAGVSGETTADGLARLDWLLEDPPDIVILEFGANDGLRGLPPEQAEQNLDTMIKGFQDKGSRVLLTGMYAPPNFGQEYTTKFNGMYQRLADKYKVTLYPFFLEGIYGDPEFNQYDGLHPNGKGTREITARLLPWVEKFVQSELEEKK